MSYPSLAQGSLVTIEALKDSLYGNIHDFSGIAKFRLFLSPYLKSKDINHISWVDSTIPEEYILKG